jgi:hypothetical protein
MKMVELGRGIVRAGDALGDRYGGAAEATPSRLAEC